MKGVFYKYLTMNNCNLKQENNQEWKIESNFLYEIENNETVKVIKQGDSFADIVYMDKVAKPNIKKINANEYIDLSTGEIRAFNHLDGKQSIRSLKNTFKRLIGLIRCNFTEGSDKQLFITLTYAENMTDTKRLYNDFKKFYQKLKRKYKEHKFEYVVVAEPQDRGAWHFHLMLKSDRYLFIDNREMEKIWGFGWTETERLKSDDVGTYYVAYFTNLETECNSDQEQKKTKKHIKGSRLHYYPKGFNFYRCSRGLKKPEITYSTWGEVVEEYGSPTWQGSYSFYCYEDGKKQEKNLVHKASFKKSNIE